MTGLRWTSCVLLALIACQPSEKPAEVPIEDGIELLTARQQLIRLSVDLRGLHPVETDLAFIEQYPDAYEQYVDRYLQDPRFLDRMEELFNYTYLTRTGETYFDPAEAGLGAVSEEVVADAIADEPLKLISHIIDRDLPFTEVLLADYSMANPVLAAMWGMDYPEGETGWQQSRYTDGRPHAGVLSMTTVWQRYPSAGVNANRHRANTLSRIFLCDDYLSRPVSFSRSQIDALTGGDPNEVIRNTEVCQSCHSTLDPLAAHFYGFWWEQEDGLFSQTTYYPEDEELWRYQADISSAYYGTPTASIIELGEQIAGDDRFVDCSVKTIFEGLTQRDTDDVDWEELQDHRAAFTESGLIVKDLVKSIVMSPEYRAVNVVDPIKVDRIPTAKTVSPSQLAGIIEGKTGYRWTFNGRDGLSRNALGLTVLAGGIDGRFVTVPSYEPSVAMAFVQERLAQSAAWYVTSHDLDPDRTDDSILLHYVTVDSRPETDREVFAAQIEALYLEITGSALEVPVVEGEEGEEFEGDVVELEPPEIEALILLWKQLYSVEASPEIAWSGVVSAVLRDPALLFY